MLGGKIFLRLEKKSGKATTVVQLFWTVEATNIPKLTSETLIKWLS